jgi:hypothetical protein
MKLYKSLSLLAVGLGAVGVVAAQGCSSSTAAPTGGTAASGTVPPGPPSAGPTTDKTTRVFALNQLFLGEVGRSGPVKDAWKDFGYNVDGLATTKTDTNVCTRVGGADPAKQEDGNGGIDNSFGHTIVGFIQGIAPNPSKTINDSIQGGSFTILLEVTGLSDDPKQSATGLSGRLLVGGTYSDDKTKKPTFATNDDWPFRASPIVPISNAYVNNGTFVNGANGADVELSLFIQGVQLSLTIKRAAITFDHTGAHDAANGTISGVINTEQLVTGIKSVAGRISTQLCGGSTLDTIEQTIRQASDIHSDGTNGPGAPCDAISIGIGFTAKEIGPAKTAAKDSPAPPDPCADAGAGGDAGGDGG